MTEFKEAFVHVWYRLDRFEKGLTIVTIPVLIAILILFFATCILVWPFFFFTKLIKQIDDKK